MDPDLLAAIQAAASAPAGAQGSDAYDPEHPNYVIPGTVSKGVGNTLEVYMGNAPRQKGLTPGRDGAMMRRHPGGGERVSAVDVAMTEFYGWSTKKRQKWADHLVKNGLLKPGEFGYDDLEKEWQAAVKKAGNLFTHGKKKVTPWQFVDEFAALHATRPTSKTTTNIATSVQEFDDLDARAMADDAYSSALGQAADGKQAAALKAALNAYAQAHPSITRSTQTTDAGGNSTSSSSTSGGISGPGAQQIAKEQTQANPEYAEYQAAATYFPIMQQALQATANVTGA